MVDSTPIDLKRWLEWASARLLATPSEKIKPSDIRVIWPEYSQDKFETLDFRIGMRLRVLAPSSDEIPIMDSILLLPNLVSGQIKRRVIRLRSLINPVSNRHLYSWVEIAEKFEIRQLTARRFFEEALIEILRKAEPGTLNKISSYMSGYAPKRRSA